MSADLELSEDDLAREFVKAHPNHRWVDAWSKWMVWDGTRWETDSTLAVFDLVRVTVRSSAFLSDDPKRVLRAAMVAAVERLARSDRAYAATVDQWDSDAWVLNTPSGVVDLRTGKIIDHEPGRYLTKITGVELESSECHRWLGFLDDITAGDSNLIDYLQRLVGYCLTGDTSEHILAFLHGGGANGKSTFLNVLRRVLGDYAINAPMETFTASHSDRHPTDPAMLRGARLVTAVETEEGRRWAESKIKALTGGAPITARFMRQDFFTFEPQFKLLIAGNHKPRLNAVDEAMRRRFHLIPFGAQFKGDQCVPDMEARLMEEAPEILHWMIEGCIQWQAQGLNPPERVTEATQAYFSNQDIFSEWVNESCETGLDFWETPTRLFNSWREFAKEAYHPIGTRAVFNDKMESLGFHWSKDRVRGRHWLGLKLKLQKTPEDWAA